MRTSHAALVVQLDSNRSVLSTARLGALISRNQAGATPRSRFGSAQPGPDRWAATSSPLLAAADVVGVAPGARVDGESPKSHSRVMRSPTLGDFLVNLDGQAGIDHPDQSGRKNGNAAREPEFDVRFAKPSLTARTIHGVTSPGPAYALFVFGLLLALLEFATAGVGLAAGTAAIMLLLGVRSASAACPSTASRSARWSSRCSASPSTCRLARPRAGRRSAPARCCSAPSRSTATA